MADTYDVNLDGEYYDGDDFEIADAQFDLRQGDKSAPPKLPAGEGERLQKVLARAGLGSRRVCEQLISRGRVLVDGKQAALGQRIDPDVAVVLVDGSRIQIRDDMVYLAFNKPAGVLSAMSDEGDRHTLSDYVQHYTDKGVRLFHVGRLDFETEGLILLTNDGALAHKLAHPSYGVQKTYIAQIQGPVARDVGRRLRDGVELDDGFARVDSFRLLDQFGAQVMVEVVLHEGRKHIVRRLLDAVGHPVQSLVRTRFGPINLGSQRSGVLRPLNSKEIGELFGSVDK